MRKNALAVMASFGSAAWPFPNLVSTDSVVPEPITVGTPHIELASLIFIAEDQGYFAGNNINATIKNYDTALAAVGGMKKGDVDISVSTEYPLATEAFKKENISVIGCIDKYETTYLIGRKDLGIENISDLKGKKVGLTRGGIVEFYLGRFLDLHGMSIHDVTLVDMKPPEYVDALANGRVDSIIAGYTFIDECKEHLGSNLIVWPAQNSQKAYFVISCRNDWAASHPKQINQFLKSIDEAEKFVINHPAEAKAIVQKRLNYTDAYMASFWPNQEYSLTLDQSLLIAMNDEGLWMIRNNLTNEKTLPNFSKYIYTRGLREVKPDAVNIR